MGLKVAKFGGSSVADAIQLMKIKEIIEADNDMKYVVVSAPGKRFDGDTKITDLLYLCKTHMDHNVAYDQLLQVIEDRFVAATVSLGIDVDFKKEFAIIKEEMAKGSATSDYLASRGEYLNGLLIAKLLNYDFVDPFNIICFNKKGKLDEAETYRLIAEELAKHEHAVIPGFYGKGFEGGVKTFSRGGSDITGAIVASAMKADVYENWTDVSGFLVADPRIVPEAKPMAHVSYQELRELSYMGASVLHDEAIYPVKAASIPINIRNTNSPEDPGTIISTEAETSEGKLITGIAGNKNYTSINISKNLMSTEVGFIRRMTAIIEDFGVCVEHIPSGVDTVSVIVSNKEVEDKIDEIVEEMDRVLKPDTIEVSDNISIIATVGAGMAYNIGTAAKLFTALAEADINIKMIDQGSSEINIIVGVENKDFEKAVRAIYDAFVK